MLIIAPGDNRDTLLIFFNMKVCCVFSLESPHRGDSNEYKQYTFTIINIKKITLNYHNFSAMGVFQGTQERVRNSDGKRAISVRATEGLLYNMCFIRLLTYSCTCTKTLYLLLLFLFSCVNKQNNHHSQLIIWPSVQMLFAYRQ